MPMYFWLLISSLPLGVSIAYFCFSPREQLLGQRLATSAHGAAVSALWFLAVLASFSGEASNWKFIGPLCAIPLALMLYAFWKYAGPKWLHWLQALNAFGLLALLFLSQIVLAIAKQ